MEDIFVYRAPLPVGVNEMVVPCLDGYTIYVRADLDDEEALKAYNHAMSHIKSCDFERCDVQAIEKKAHCDTF